MQKRLTYTAEISLKLLLAGSAVVLMTGAGHVQGRQAANPAAQRVAADFTMRGYGAVGPAAQAGQPNAGGRATTTVPPTRNNLYVAPGGSDSNPGTADAPFRSIARAARSARPDTTVFVAPGTYDGSFKTTASGNAGGRIYYVSTTRWGAVIVPPPKSSAKHGWDNRGNYVDIVGFHVDGSVPRSGTRWTVGIYNGGSYDNIRGNWVHHIADKGKCNSGGGSAIGVDSYYKGIQSNVVGNLVHDIGPAGCRYVQGIYMSTSGSIQNNVVYRVAEGAIHLWHDARDVIIANNTVAASNTGIIVGGGDYYHTSGPADRIQVYSNIVFDNRMGISEQGRTGPSNSYRNNLVYANSTYNWKLNNGLGHAGTVTSDPLLIGYSRSGVPNLKPSPSSPVVGRGSDMHALPYDFTDRPRNPDTGFDIGAYQH